MEFCKKYLYLGGGGGLQKAKKNENGGPCAYFDICGKRDSVKS